MPINVNGNEINSVGAKVIADSGLVTTNLSSLWDFGLNTCYPGSGTTLSNLAAGAQAWTLTNGPTYSTLGGGSLLFDGGNDYLQYANAGSYTLLAAHTMYFWIKTSGDAGLHSHYSGGPVVHAMRIAGGKLAHSYYNTTWRENYSSGATVTTNNWTMITYAMVSGTGTQTAYVNGVADWTFTIAGGHGNASAGSIGSLWGYGYFGGYMGQIIEYNGTTHTAAQVLQNFNATRQRYGV